MQYHLCAFIDLSNRVLVSDVSNAAEHTCNHQDRSCGKGSQDSKVVLTTFSYS